MISTHCILAHDSTSLGKIDAGCLSEQSCMELLVANITDIQAFQDDNGEYHEIQEWGGMSVSPSGNVAHITWDFDDYPDLGMDEGVIQCGGSMDVQWLPPKLISFAMSCLHMEGTIDTSLLPRSLILINVTGNRFTGSFRLQGLPDFMARVFLENNMFSGTLDIPSLPGKMKILNASLNQFSGSLDLSSLPETIVKLHLSNNQFSGEVDLRKLPVWLHTLTLNGNQIQQDVLTIGNLPHRLNSILVDPGKFATILHANGKALKLLKVGEILFVQMDTNV